MTTDEGVRPVRQARSARTRDRVLAAIDEALADGVLERLGVVDIAARAGVSVGAFYGRFEDKAAALAALHAKRREEFVERLLQVGETGEAVEAWAREAARLALDHARANRPLLARAALADRPPASLFSDARAGAPELVGALVRLFRSRFGLALAPAAATAAASFVLAMIGAMARDAAVYSGALIERPKAREWYAGEIGRAVAAYLASLAPAPPLSSERRA